MANKDFNYNNIFKSRGARLRLALHVKSSKVPVEILSKKAGVSRYSITMYVDGRADIPLEACSKMAKALKVSPEWLSCADNSSELKVALYKGDKPQSDEEWQEVMNYVELIRSDYEKKN